jgi:hypothetical protein
MSDPVTSLDTARALRQLEEDEAREERLDRSVGYPAHRAAEIASAAEWSHHHYTRTFRGREEAQRVAASMRAQLERTKEAH